uniref:Uncharacterized protein n=1 Tax=Cacopsylla melanoneura TaxID=428564 RepID=A0A8D8VM20_9HEMI
MACLFRILLLMSSIYTLRAQEYHGHCPRSEGEGEAKHGGLYRIRREVNTELPTMNDNPKELKQEIGGGGEEELETKVKVEPSTKVELKEESTTKIEKDELYKKPKDNDARNIASLMNKYYKKLKKENATGVEQRMNIKRQKYFKEYRRVLQRKKLKEAFKPRSSTYNYIKRVSSRLFKSFRPFNSSRNRGFARSRHPSFNASHYKSPYRTFNASRYKSHYRPFNASRYESHYLPFNASRFESHYRPFDESRNREFDRSHFRPFDASHNRQFDRPRHPSFNNSRSASHYRLFDASRNRKFDQSHYRPFDASNIRVSARSHYRPLDASRIRESTRSVYRPFNVSRRRKFDTPRHLLLNDSRYGSRYRPLNASRELKQSRYVLVNDSGQGLRYCKIGSLDGTLNTSRYRGSERPPYGPHYGLSSRYRGFTRSRNSDFDRSFYGDHHSKSYYRPKNGSPYDSSTRPRFRGANVSRYRWSDRQRPHDFDWSHFGKSRYRTGNGTRFIEINGSRYRDLADFERLQRIKQLKGEFRPGNASDRWERERLFGNRPRNSGSSRFNRFNGSRHQYDRRLWARSGNGTRYIEINGTRYRNLDQFERVQRIKQFKGEFRPGVNEERWSGRRDFYGRPGYRNFSSRTYYRGNFSGGRRDFSRGAGRPPYGGGAGRPGYGGGTGRPGYGPGAGKRDFGWGAGRRGAPKRQFRGGPGRVRVGENVQKPDYWGRRNFRRDGRTGRRQSRYGRRRYGQRRRGRGMIVITSHPLDQQEHSARKYWFKELESVLIEMKKDAYKRKGLTLSPEELNLNTGPTELTEYDRYRAQNKWQRLADLHSVRLHVHFTPRAVPRPKWNSTGRKKVKRKKVKPVTQKPYRSRKQRKNQRKKNKKKKAKGKGDKKAKKVS